MAVVQKKREIEATHALDETFKNTVRQHELTCQALETEMASLRKQLRDSTAMASSAYESGWRAGRQDSQVVLQEKNDLISAHLTKLSDGMDYISRCYNRPGVSAGSNEVGSAGEAFIESQLRSFFPSDRIVFTGKETLHLW